MINITQYKRNNLDIIQYVIALLILITFSIGLIPFTYQNFYQIAIILIIIQLIISIIRLRPINFILESILLIIAILGIIPIIGYIIRIPGLIITIIDFATFKNIFYYKKINIFNTKCHNNQEKQKSKKQTKKFNNDNIKEADFKEK